MHLKHSLSKTTELISTKLVGRIIGKWGFKFVKIQGLASIGAQ